LGDFTEDFEYLILTLSIECFSKYSTFKTNVQMAVPVQVPYKKGPED